MNDTFLYFAYGSDMSLPQMRGRMLEAELVLEDDARSAARLPGYRLLFNRTVTGHDSVGHANLQAAAGGVVEGVLYRLPLAVLPVLDQCEGVAQQQCRRIEVEVQDAAGTQKAYAYVAEAAWEKADLKPSRNHLYRLLSAHRYLSPEYFALLKATESIKVAVDDEGMPHGTKKKVKRLAEATETARALAPAPKPAKASKPAAVDADGEEKAEKKKFYPAVGAYAPKSARAFRKAFGIPEKDDKKKDEAPRAERPRAPSPWAGRGEARSENRSDSRGERPQAKSPWAGRGGESRGPDRGSRSERPQSRDDRGSWGGQGARGVQGKPRSGGQGGKKPGRPW